MSILKGGKRVVSISIASGSRQHGPRAMSLGSSYRNPGASMACYQSPSGLTSSDESEGDSPRFSFLAPSGFTGAPYVIHTVSGERSSPCSKRDPSEGTLPPPHADSDSEEEGEVVQSRAGRTPTSAGAPPGMRVPTPPQRAAMERRALARQQLEVPLHCMHNDALEQGSWPLLCMLGVRRSCMGIALRVAYFGACARRRPRSARWGSSTRRC
jgi:hypothetical protein